MKQCHQGKGWQLHPMRFTAEYGVPRGVIVMWSGSIADIPQGWALCDGTNGTPDLRDRFIKSIPNNSTNPGSTGGNSAHIHTTPNHQHGSKLGGENQNATDSTEIWTGFGESIGGKMFIKGSETPAATSVRTGTDVSGGSNTSSASSLPPYYEVAFIMKS